MKVLHLLAPAHVGGLERVVCTLVTGQRAAGVDARVACIVERSEKVHPVVHELRESGVTVHEIALAPRAYAEERRRVAHVCAEWRPHVVHTHGYRPSVMNARVIRRLSIPCVTTFHGFTGGDWRNRMYEWLERRTARTMDAVIAVSEPLRRRLASSGIPEDRLHVVVNAHRARSERLTREQARAALGLPLQGFILGWIGRLTHEKGADVLIDALPFLGDESVTAAIVGDGPLRPALTGRAESSAHGRVRWQGLVPDAADYLRAFDVFVLSSRTEGTPMVIFEAMDAEVPIVATRVGGVPDVLRADDALLVPSEDARALAHAIQSVRADTQGAAQRAANAKSRLTARYAVEPWIAQYSAIYSQVTHRPASK